ncbi:MAG: tRNA pseudouridine(55) synthase TruB [Alphaproteobacteria bacterium]|nr:tRNA pseudouridine(55) synthase TruB [Alphaproteobacteria bacterium]
MSKNQSFPIHGWLIVDKPEGLTSARVVSIVKKILNAKKVGHAGTLDPLASGVLPLALGEATKTVSHMMAAVKTYTFEVRWGEQRDTDDAEGTVIATSSHRPHINDIQKAIKKFVGVIQQIPPRFSAIKVEGQRAYKTARTQEPIVLAARNVIIEEFHLKSIKDADHAEFTVVCHKGTYVRSLARDLAQMLGTVGYIKQLRRNKTGRFDEASSISLEKIKELGHNLLSKGVLHPIETVLDDIPAIRLQAVEQQKLSQGQPVRFVSQTTEGIFEGTVLCFSLEGLPVALATVKEGFIQPKRGFNIQ